MIKNKKFFLILFFVSVLLVFAKYDNWKSLFLKYTRTHLLLKSIHYKGKIEDEKLSFAAIRGMLKTLDPHSYLLDPDSFQTMKEDQLGKFYGIGIQILKIEDRLTVITPLEGTPAYRLGIQAGDVIVEVEGKSTKNLSQNEAVRLLRGPKGTFVNIKIKREGYKKLIPFKIKRAEIPLYSIPYHFVDPYVKDYKLGIIVIRSFTGTTVEEFEKAMKELIKKRIKGLILDLRFNGGGDLKAALGISDEFLSEGKVIVSTKGRVKKMNRVFKAKQNGQYENIPLVILVNRGSASASEIVSGAIQDNKRGIIVGTRTWGKGLVQTLFYLRDNVAIALTTARYYTPSGKMIQRDYTHLEDYLLFYNDKGSYERNTGGIVPDFVVEGGNLTIFTANLRSKGLFFSYANHLVKKETNLKNIFGFDKEGMRYFIKDKPYHIFYDEVPKKIVDDFKNFIKKRKIKFSDKVFNKSLESVKLELKREIASRIWGIQEGFISILKNDPQIKKAEEILIGNKIENKL